ncbi:MAG: clostripain-related cysteine peptidase [Elusimicrobiota bacterium]
MKKIIYAAAVILGLAGGAYAESALEQLGEGSIKAARPGFGAPPVSAPAHEKGWFEPKPQAIKEWTVLVYLNGKNDLEVAGLYNLNKMELAGSNAALNIVAEEGRMNGQENDVDFDGNWTGSRRYYVTQDTDEEIVKSKVIQSFRKVDMGDWRHLADFAKWGMKNYPAKHYALIVWNHGSGWITTKGGRASKGISYDHETKNHISTPELGAAMKEIGKVDILAYDACLMQMAEVLYEVKDYADYVVGSEETVPGTGFPYDTLLPAFTGSKNSGELAVEMVRAYDDFYSVKGKKVTLSAVRVSALGDFMTAFNAWTDALIASDKKPQIKSKAYSAGAYAYKDNKDLYDFARLAAEADPQGPVAETSRALMETLNGKLVISNTAYKDISGRDEASHGLAIYLPTSGYNEKYDQLAWARDTRWDDFLKELKGVSAPGMEQLNGCVDPGPGASLQQLMAYIDCLTSALGTSKP